MIYQERIITLLISTLSSDDAVESATVPAAGARPEGAGYVRELAHGAQCHNAYNKPVHRAIYSLLIEIFVKFVSNHLESMITFYLVQKKTA